MAKSRKIPSHDQNGFTDRQSITLVEGIFAAHRRVASDLKKDDKWPNTDGDINIQDTADDQAEIVGTFRVQVKTLPETGKLTFPCGVGFLEYCKNIHPVLLLIADNTAEKVYWNYLDEEAVKEVDDGTNTTTITIKLTEEKSFDKKDQAYIEVWTKLFSQKRNQVSALEKRVKESLNAEIDVAKQRLEEYRYSEALGYLLDLKVRRWDQADDNARFRILANIAAAQAHLDLIAEAANNFLEAYEFQPNLPKAQANKAIAHLLKNEYQEALDQADVILKTNPIDVSASSTKVQAMMYLGKKLKDIETSLDEKAIDDGGVAYALSIVAREEGSTHAMMSYLERAIRADKNSPYIHADLGINILEALFKNYPKTAKGILTNAQTEEVKRALALLQKAWQNLPDNRDRKLNAVWLFDIVMAYRTLGLECDAEKASEELLRLVPDNEIYIKNAAVIAFQAKKYDVAEAYYRQLIKEGSKMSELSVMLVDALRAQKKDKEALKVCEKYLATHKKYDSIYVDICESQYDIYIQDKDLDRAQLLTDRLLAEPKMIMLGSLFAARLSRIKQDTESATRFLEKAEAAISDNTYLALVLGLAEEAFWSAAYEIAARSYARVVQPTFDIRVFQRYLRSLYEARRYEEAIKVASAIREDSGASRPITQFEWGSYLQLQDLPNARKVLEEYVQEYPEDEDARLNLAIIFIRSNDLKALDSYLASNIDLIKLDLLAEIQLANLYRSRGNPRRTLEITYDARRHHLNDADAHSAYVSIFMGLEDSISNFIDSKTVQADSVLLYDGGYFIVETTYEPQISDNEISLEDAKKRGFIGKKKGDLVVLNHNQLSGENEVKVTEVQSKYIFALHDSMKNYERRFSDRNDLMGFKVDDKNFAPLFKQLDQRHEQTQSIEQLYKEGKLTIDLFAKLVGRNIIETFYALRGTPDLGIRVANGTVEESKAVQVISQEVDEVQVVADITALITFFELGLKPTGIGLKKFIVAQRTKDLVLELITQLETIGKKESMTLYKSGGQYIRQVVTAKEQRQNLNSMKKFAKWVEANTVVRALTQKQIDAIEAKAKEPEVLEELINEAQFDTIKLAVGDDRLLYSDDVGLRSLSETTFGVKGIWTQALLAIKLPADEHERVTVDLVIHNYHHVAINPQVLLYAAKVTNWQPKEPLLSILKSLSRPEVNPASMVIVLVNFLYELYRQTTVMDKNYILQQILNEATRHHDRNEFIGHLRRGLGIRFKLLPIQLKEIDETIVAWLKLHDI